MPRLSLWNSGKHGHNDRYIDRQISQWYGASGTACYVHMYLGVSDQTVTATPTDPTITSIQDVLFLENRDRQYSQDIVELRGIYNVADSDFNLRQFGLFLTADTLFLSFHLNDMVSRMGRKLMTGDVIELPHQRDDFLLNGAPSINKFYVVEDASRASEGYGPTWWPYIWRVKVGPLTDSEEFSGVLNAPALDPLGLPILNPDGTPATIDDLMTTSLSDDTINQAVVDAARANVNRRYFETQQFWFVPGTTSVEGRENPWIFAGDGIPPNGALLVGSGTVYPTSPNVGDYYLRTDYAPPTLFQWSGVAWSVQEADWRGADWTAAHRLLQGFLNNDNISTFQDGTVAPEKTNLSQAVKPRADF